MASSPDRSRRVPCVRFVRHNAANETIPCTLADESAAFDRLAQGSAALGQGVIVSAAAAFNATLVFTE